MQHEAHQKWRNFLLSCHFQLSCRFRCVTRCIFAATETEPLFPIYVDRKRVFWLRSNENATRNTPEETSLVILSLPVYFY